MARTRFFPNNRKRPTSLLQTSALGMFPSKMNGHTDDKRGGSRTFSIKQRFKPSSLSVSQIEHNVRCGNEGTTTTASMIETLSDTAERLASLRDADDDGDQIERACIRLDGLEVYAVVAALTISTSIGVIDLYVSPSWTEMYANGMVITFICKLVFLACTYVGSLLGLYATLVFSLTVMYGKTAMGMYKEDAFGDFYHNTMKQRIRGFKAFLFSIYAFLIQIVLLMSAMCPQEMQLVSVLFGCLSVSMIYKDTEDIVSKAGIIYAPPKRVNATRTDSVYFRTPTT
uniref:Uncharacterized protein n=1 Tax=Odontella aurita TaxID=265563 RepID=A0A7S4IWS9_9STRA|mmetsp:Transcript_31659/g.94728  ORF Transcript_31659/g.94728 Transcript_31659/m.94728 type:complete len:285 (+) Transcript_31659:190-1044(+)